MKTVFGFCALVMAAMPLCAFASGEDGGCAVTPAPQPAFSAPAAFTPATLDEPGYFYFGTVGLWAPVRTHWKLGQTERKLPFFSQRFDWLKERPPQMTVQARRLDGPAPVVHAEEVHAGGPSFRYGEQPDMTKPGFMVTALQLPSAGCWEISARYQPPSGGVETLTYTVQVEP